MLGIIAISYGLCQLCLDMTGRFSKPNENYLQLAKEANAPNFNFMFASNDSLAGRIVMTLTPEHRKPCINTATSFYNKYNTCSNCEEFEDNPERWNFEKTTTPKIGDILIQHDESGKAYHAARIIDIKDGEYYVNHADGTKYIKNARLKNKARLTFYRFISVNYAENKRRNNSQYKCHNLK